MFPDTSETSDFESSRHIPGPGSQQLGSEQPTGRERNPYFFQTIQNHSKVESTIEDALLRFKYYSKIKNFIKREDTNPVNY